MKIELDVDYDPVRHGLIVFIPRAALLAWMASDAYPVRIPEASPEVSGTVTTTWENQRRP